MTVQQFNFTTGPASLPDVGTLAYNGCTFSPFFHTEMSGKIVKDEAQRTTKLMEYKLSVEGFVTLSDGALSISLSIRTMRRLLQQQGAVLTYTGRGFDLFPTTQEVAWGPVPELLEFQPLGGGLSAKVKWEVTFRTPDVPMGSSRPYGINGAANSPLLQFNYETTLTYGEDYYSSMSVKGTMEILLNRQSNSAPNSRVARQLTTTVDDVRTELDKRIFSGIDLSRFYVVRRDYHVSRDKRTMQFDVAVEEKPYMDLPANCVVARGSYNVRPVKAGPGLAMWLCTLRATYTVRADAPRRWAWTAFLALLQLRMGQANIRGNVPQPQDDDNQNVQNPQDAGVNALGVGTIVRGIGQAVVPGVRELEAWAAGMRAFIRQQQATVNRNPQGVNSWLIDFSFDEGLYKDSKTVTFSATWRLVTTLSHILLASGIWRKLPETSLGGVNLWAASMRSISGATTWMPNYLDPSKDVIIDFGY